MLYLYSGKQRDGAREIGAEALHQPDLGAVAAEDVRVHAAHVPLAQDRRGLQHQLARHVLMPELGPGVHLQQRGVHARAGGQQLGYRPSLAVEAEGQEARLLAPQGQLIPRDGRDPHLVEPLQEGVLLTLRIQRHGGVLDTHGRLRGQRIGQGEVKQVLRVVHLEAAALVEGLPLRVRGVQLGIQPRAHAGIALLHDLRPRGERAEQQEARRGLGGDLHIDVQRLGRIQLALDEGDQVPCSQLHLPVVGDEKGILCGNAAVGGLGMCDTHKLSFNKQ